MLIFDPPRINGTFVVEELGSKPTSLEQIPKLQFPSFFEAPKFEPISAEASKIAPVQSPLPLSIVISVAFEREGPIGAGGFFSRRTKE